MLDFGRNTIPGYETYGTRRYSKIQDSRLRLIARDSRGTNILTAGKRSK